MPELPEVEAARRALFDNCCGRKIVEAQIADDPIVINAVSPSDLQKALEGRKIVDVRRKGKNLWIELDARPWPSFQFGMTGAFYIKGKEVTKYKRSAVSNSEAWPSKFSKVFLKLDDGLEVSFTDKRRLARVRLLKDPTTEPPVSELGLDALLELPDESTFARTILRKNCSIKALLLDQSFLAGIGNWVADEVLYQARVHPEQVASSLSEKDCVELHKAIREVLKISVDVDADSDRFPENWIFHYRWNKKGGELEGNKISFITVGGRTSAYVPTLQKCTSFRKPNNGDKTPVESEGQNVETETKTKRGRSKLAADIKESDKVSTSKNNVKRKVKNEMEPDEATEEIPQPKKGRKTSKKKVSDEDEFGIVEPQLKNQENLEPITRKNLVDDKAGKSDRKMATKGSKKNMASESQEGKSADADKTMTTRGSRKSRASKNEEVKSVEVDKAKVANMNKVDDNLPSKRSRKMEAPKDVEEKVASGSSGRQKRSRGPK